MALRVIGAGVGRTGTLSLKAALEELGFARCYHMTDVLAFEDKPFAIDVFNRFNEQVRRTVPADRLLVYQVQEGWGPLCAFLGVPIPQGKPFPHLNDAVEFRSRIQRAAGIMRTVGYIGLGAVALFLAWLASKVIWR